MIIFSFLNILFFNFIIVYWPVVNIFATSVAQYVFYIIMSIFLLSNKYLHFCPLTAKRSTHLTQLFYSSVHLSPGFKTLQ